jgi:hypothetical protein
MYCTSNYDLWNSKCDLILIIYFMSLVRTWELLGMTPALRLFVTADFINNESKIFNISKPWYILHSFHIHYRLYRKLASCILIGYLAATVRICNPLSVMGVILVVAPNVSPPFILLMKNTSQSSSTMSTQSKLSLSKSTSVFLCNSRSYF